MEVGRHTRERTRVGDEPVSQLRERVSREAAVARLDPDALALDVADDRARLTRSVYALREGMPPAARRMGERLRRPMPWCLVVIQALLLIRASRRR